MLQTKNIFIDTQCFVKSGLHFEGVAFKAFYDLCTSGELTLITTSIVEREVHSKIDDSIKDALQAVQTIQRKAKILQSIEGGPLQSFFSPLETDGVYESAKQAFNEFLDDCNAEFAPLSEVDIEQVLNDYFGKNAPFGEGKKKAEFPDAISLSAVEKYVEDVGVYIVSEDEDLKKYCDIREGFYQVDTLEKLLDIYNSHGNSLSKAISLYVENHQDEIKLEIESLLEGADAYNDSSWEDSEIESFQVISMSDLDPSIISIDGDTCILTFDISVNFEVTASGPDFTNGYWDGEDKVMIPMDSTQNVEVEEKNFLVEVEMQFSISGDEIIDVHHNIHIDKLGVGLAFSVEENSYY
jgi:hypothetical protein